MIYIDPPVELMLYKRYIDDLIIVWNGSKKSLEEFLLKLDDNDKNIQLVWKIDEKSVDFLDLSINLEEDKVVIKTHLKNVDTNSYLSMDSCHLNCGCIIFPKDNWSELKGIAQRKKTT